MVVVCEKGQRKDSSCWKTGFPASIKKIELDGLCGFVYVKKKPGLASTAGIVQSKQI